MADGRIVVLLTLKPGKDAAAYEQWARTTDLPTVKALGSVDEFSLYQATGLLGGGAAPYDYIEILDISDQEAFFADVDTDRMKTVAAEFQDWADPVFITTRKITL